MVEVIVYIESKNCKYVEKIKNEIGDILTKYKITGSTRLSKSDKNGLFTAEISLHAFDSDFAE